MVVFRVAKSEDSQSLAVVFIQETTYRGFRLDNKDLQRVAVEKTKLSTGLANSGPIPLTLPKQVIALMLQR